MSFSKYYLIILINVPLFNLLDLLNLFMIREMSERTPLKSSNTYILFGYSTFEIFPFEINVHLM